MSRQRVERALVRLEESILDEMSRAERERMERLAALGDLEARAAAMRGAERTGLRFGDMMAKQMGNVRVGRMRAVVGVRDPSSDVATITVEPGAGMFALRYSAQSKTLSVRWLLGTSKYRFETRRWRGWKVDPGHASYTHFVQATSRLDAAKKARKAIVGVMGRMKLAYPDELA